MACVASLEVKHRKEKTSRLGNNEHKTIFAFHEESKLDAPDQNQSKRLATLSLRALCSQEVQVAEGWWLCTGTLGCSWHSWGGQHRSQVTGHIVQCPAYMNCLVRSCFLDSALAAAFKSSSFGVHRI